METIRNREMDRINNALISVVSHEMRTPIATIKGYSTMLYDYLPSLSMEETKEYIRSIDNAADRLNNIISNLLDTSLLETGMLKLEIAPVNVAKLIKTAITEAAARENRPGIVFEPGSNLTRVYMDEKRIRQVLDNLIDNAVRRSLPTAKILISAHNDGKELTVKVTDYGAEIPADTLGKIFDLFYKDERKPSSGAHYVGLGLYVCRQLVEAHGGRIGAISAAGTGTTIQFSLPAIPLKNNK